MSGAPEMTICQFVELVLDTEITEAAAWFEGWKGAIPGGSSKWADYASLPLTQGAVECFALGIQAQISRQCRNLAQANFGHYDEVYARGRAFLQEIHRKAVESGIEVDLCAIDCLPGR